MRKLMLSFYLSIILGLSACSHMSRQPQNEPQGGEVGNRANVLPVVSIEDYDSDLNRLNLLGEDSVEAIQIAKDILTKYAGFDEIIMPETPSRTDHFYREKTLSLIYMAKNLKEILPNLRRYTTLAGSTLGRDRYIMVNCRGLENKEWAEEYVILKIIPPSKYILAFDYDRKTEIFRTDADKQDKYGYPRFNVILNIGKWETALHTSDFKDWFEKVINSDKICYQKRR